jgi:3-hydroxyanthranilate 3,4-dioxygenase
MLLPPTNIDEWVTTHADCFVPPICNKLMHKKQLSIMFVGGPNQRKDFHMESGSELFLMLKGNM